MENNKTVSWLYDHRIWFYESSLKAELLYWLIVSNTWIYLKIYNIDHRAEENGHSILTVIPYHCALDFIEIIWSQTNGYIRQSNNSFKL